MQKKLIIILIVVLVIGLTSILAYHFIDTKSNVDNNYVFNLDKENKYEIVKLLTMLNDGGSNTKICYQIDIDNNKVTKINESYQASPNDGKSTTTKEIIYTKDINRKLRKETTNLIKDIITRENNLDSDNYNNYYVITNYENGKKINHNIYNLDTITEIKTLLQKFDNLE